MDDAETLRQYAQNVRGGATPGPKALKWMRETADKMGLDFDTLIGGSRAGAVTSGAVSGAAFNFDDEIAGIGRAIVPGGLDYEGGRDRRRKINETQQFMNPAAYLSGEIGGGVASSFVPVVGQVGRGAGLVRAGITGAALGGLDAYGRTEGELGDNLGQIATGAGLGLGGALVGDVIGKLLSRGPRVAAAGQEEIQRIMRETGLSGDDVVAGIADGSIAAQNRTLLMDARAAYNNASTKVRQEVRDAAIGNRTAGRQEIVETLQQELPENLRNRTTSPNFRAATEVPDASSRYTSAYAAGNDQLGTMGLGMSQQFQDLVERAAFLDKRSVASANEAARAAWVQAGRDPAQWSPLMRIKDGQVQWRRRPIAEEVAQISRGVNARATEAYKSSSPLAKALDDTGKALRQEAGEMMPEWNAITSEVANSKAMRDGYEMASKVGSSDQRAMELLSRFSQMSDVEQAGVKAGLVEEVERRMRKAGPSSMVTRSMVDTGDGQSMAFGQLLREVFPGDELDRIINRADGRQAVYNALTGGSQTAELLARQGMMGDTAAEVFGTAAIDTASGGVMGAAMQGARRLVKPVANLITGSEQQAGLVLRALTTEDAQVLQRALQGDLTSIQQFQAIAREILAKGGMVAAPDVGGQFFNGQ